jgi:hypothetical protein
LPVRPGNFIAHLRAVSRLVRRPPCPAEAQLSPHSQLLCWPE